MYLPMRSQPGNYFLLATLAFATCSAAAGAEPAEASKGGTNAVENSVVKIFATARYPDYFKPWTKTAPADMTGSGVVIEGKRILSNAHVVLYASQVQVQANQAGDKLPATVEAVALDMDMAILKLEDESFFASHPPLARAKELPEIKDSVVLYGYPHGGNSLSLTKGIVSRIEFAGYSELAAGLRIQIDAAVNPGNSGGPALVGDKMIGLAYSKLGGGAENIGYIIPCEEIELFFKRIVNGQYQLKNSLFENLQTLENPALRPFLKLDRADEGMIVREPRSTNADYPLKAWDLITKIGDTPIDDEGMIKLRPSLPVGFNYLVQKLETNGAVPLTVVRAGKKMEVRLPVTPRPQTVMPFEGGRYPSYFVYGPMVFATATIEFAQSLMSASDHVWTGYLMARGSPLVQRWGDKPAFDGEQLVVVPSPLFPHKLSKGYSNPVGEVVKTINGIPIKNLNHLVAVLRDTREEFIVIEFHGTYNEKLVFPRAETVAATEEILTDNGVRSQGSPDTMAIWKSTSDK
jgi:S1-C subfamily serine protease